MDLHYSQTWAEPDDNALWFHYLMDLHYSQTGTLDTVTLYGFTTLWIYTILKQDHYGTPWNGVSLPYGFTLFSNLTV